jgi:hypothetical protein
VRRLRAAADKAREAQISTFDKMIIRGRVWADRAHRFTALSLIGATCMPFLSCLLFHSRNNGNGTRGDCTDEANWCM